MTYRGQNRAVADMIWLQSFCDHLVHHAKRLLPPARPPKPDQNARDERESPKIKPRVTH